MKFITPEISWHERDPVYSVDLQNTGDAGGVRRLATCGTDRNIRVSARLHGDLNMILPC